MAIIRAIQIFEIPLQNHEIFLNIYSDSEYAIMCCTSYGDKQSRNNWVNSIPNYQLVKDIYYLYQRFKNSLSINHIRAHTGNNDVHSYGNSQADRLANLAINF